MRFLTWIVAKYSSAQLEARQDAPSGLPSGPRQFPPFDKTGFVLSFPYVCPEPVLAKSSFLYINGAKSPFFHLCDGAGGAHQVVPACDNPSDKNTRVT
jgi:hypothetical protein